ncbi:MAG: NACHT domain-containing protein [Dolichospermum lemmermannii FEM_B0920]
MPEAEEPKQVSNNDLRNAQFGGGLINAETVNAQRIGGDIWNFFLGQQLTPIGNPARPKNQRKLLASVKEEVTARLRQSLHNAVLINLGKEAHPQQVKRPWDAEIKIGLKPPEPFPDTTSIFEVFNSEEIAGKLLILGAPGAGKTTSLLELAQALIAKAEEQPDYPIPVLFNLSFWKDNKQNLHNWLVSELKSKYGVQKDIAEDWVNTHQILPMLDGLDELESNRQELCVQAINQVLQSEIRPQYLVVCSRNEEYTKYETCLLLNGAIYLKSLTENQIHQYLTDVKQEKLWHFISNEPHLFELTKIPLFLSIFILAYQEIFRNSWENMTEKRWHNISAEKWGQITSANSFTLQNLLDTYVQQMFTRELLNTPYTKHKQPSARQTRRWLIWLAKQLERESQTEFLLESIQPAWLQSNVQKKMYQVIFTLSAVLISGTIGGLAGSLIFGGNNGLSIGLFCAFIFALNIIFSTSASRVSRANPSKNWTKRDIIFNWILKRLEINIFYIDDPINPVEEFQLSWERIKQAVITNLPRVFVSWIFLTLFSRFQLIDGLMICGFLILVWSLQIGAGLFDKPDIERRRTFNQSIQQSIITACGLVLLMCCGVVVVFWINKIWKTSIITTGGLVYCLILAVAIWQGAGGLFCLQHFTLRYILHRNRYIPWNYARFLDYCTELGFLQRVGGRYRFIHKLLQDHFAQMEFRRK